jgi:hypothetical protein
MDRPPRRARPPVSQAREEGDEHHHLDVPVLDVAELVAHHCLHLLVVQGLEEAPGDGDVAPCEGGAVGEGVGDGELGDHELGGPDA